MTKLTFPVEASHVMMFARSLLDQNPVYYDANAAPTKALGGVIAPPTFPIAVKQFDPDSAMRPNAGKPWFGSAKEPSGAAGTATQSQAPSGGVLHAEQYFEYHRHPKVGDVFTVERKLGRTWEKEGRRSGKLTFRETTSEYRDQKGELVVTARSIAVTTGRPVDQE